jgi:hypothetical protein
MRSDASAHLFVLTLSLSRIRCVLRCAQDVVVRTYGARRSPFDILAPSAAAALRAAAEIAEERLAFAAYLRPRL